MSFHPMSKTFGICVGALLCVALARSDAHGQTPPPGAQSGQVEKQFQKPPEPSARQGVITIQAPGQTPPPNADSVKFVLNQLTLDGATAYPGAALRGLYANSLQKEVTLADIYRIVEGLTAKYRNDGYILSQVIVPAQTVEGGAIRLQVVEGYIAEVRVEGGSAAMRDRIRKYGDKIRGVRPLTIGALERYVLLMNDLPGVMVRAVLARSAVPGASDLVLQVSQRRLAADFTSDNRGSRAQGPGRVSGELGVHSLFGASRTELRGVTTFTPELLYLAIAHDQFVGAQGGKFEITASYVYSKPEELSFIPLDLATRSETATLSYVHPILRRRSHNLYMRGSFGVFDSTTKVFGIDDTVDRVRAVRLGLTYDGADGLGGVNIADIEFTQGLSALGASKNGDRILSRPTGRTDFRKTTLYAARMQSLPANWSILLGVDGQYAHTDLLASELFSVGGELFGRGYDPSELLNDHGAAAKLDLRYSKTWNSRRPTTLMPYVFGDVGRAWQRTPIPGIAASQSAASAGGGIRLNIGTQFSSFVEAAKPLTTIVGLTSNRNVRLYAGVSVR
jgi:hemolysin activation/secretion protein